MPEQETRAASVGISSSVAVFLLLTSTCCVLSLWSTGNNEEPMKTIQNSTYHWQCGDKNQDKTATLPSYIPNIAMFSVMCVGIIAMVAFIFRREHLTTGGHECQLTSRHNLHSKYSLWSITAFFVGGCILHLNYILVELTCIDSWVRCDSNGVEVFLINFVEIMFHIGCIVFASCETIVCWTIKYRNFKPSQWVWHAAAFVQAANIALWFDSLLKESYRRIYDNSASFDAYFSFCPATKNHSEAWCSESSIAANWFVWSCPFLFPITIELALLVSETLLDRVIGGGMHTASVSHNTSEHHNDREAAIPANGEINGVPNEQTPLLQPTRDTVHSETENAQQSTSSKMFILISFIINIVYLVLTILVFIGYKSSHKADIQTQLQTFDNAFAVYSVIYDLFSVTCCAVGIVICRSFKRPYSHTSFLEYLLLFATVGVLLQSVKHIVGLALNGQSSNWIAPYYMVVFLDIVQSLIQIVFYYYAKDVKLQLTDEGSRRVAVFKSILTVVSLCNIVTWLSNSFLLPEMSASITPSNYFIEQWPVFDNAATPISIFFRFNSALLFWCIGTDILKPSELHQD